jgi:hypothetical protein
LTYKPSKVLIIGKNGCHSGGSLDSIGTTEESQGGAIRGTPTTLRCFASLQHDNNSKEHKS